MPALGFGANLRVFSREVGYGFLKKPLRIPTNNVVAHVPLFTAIPQFVQGFQSLYPIKDYIGKYSGHVKATLGKPYRVRL